MTGEIGKIAPAAERFDAATASGLAAPSATPTDTPAATVDSGPTYRTGQQLLARFEATGEEMAFEQIVRLYAGMVYTVCNGVTKNNHDAEDATQATFLALASQVKLGKSVKYLGPWLRQVAKRTALDLRKSRKRREKREQNHNQQTCGATFEEHAGEANLNAEEYKQLLHDEINRLPARYRLPLVMHYFGGLKPEQTALELNCKPKTLAVRLHRGRKMLAEKLSRRGLFVGSEMLGCSVMPFLAGTMHSDALHQTAHAASSLLTGHDISTLISSRVMSLLRASAQAAFFAKVKLFAIIAVMVLGTFAGGASAVRAIGGLPTSWHLPSIKFNLGDWIRPMLRSVAPTPKFIADASSTNTKSAPTRSNEFGAPTAALAVRPTSSPRYSFAAFDSTPVTYAVSVSSAALTRNQVALLESGNVGAIDLTEPATDRAAEFDLRAFVPPPTSAPSAIALLNVRSGDQMSAGTLAALGSTAGDTRAVNPNQSAPAPEPANLLLVSAGAALLVVRRRETK